TIGSASTALASGTIFTIPALFLWGMIPPYLEVVALCFLGGLLGLAAMIPLRKLLIVDSASELPYPEGTACAEVLRATVGGGSGGHPHGGAQSTHHVGRLRRRRQRLPTDGGEPGPPRLVRGHGHRAGPDRLRAGSRRLRRRPLFSAARGLRRRRGHLRRPLRRRRG